MTNTSLVVSEAEDEHVAERPLAALASRLVSVRELKRRPKPQYLIQDVMAQTGVGQLWGPTYSGKTFVGISLSLSVTNGRPWFGFPVNLRGPVVYALMEGAFDFAARIDAYLAANTGATEDNLWVLPEESLNLVSSESLNQLETDINALEIHPRLIVIDTQALATPGVEENSNTDMGLVLSNLKKLAKRYGCFCLLIHHTGHDQSHARGASAQRAALDTEIKVDDGRVQVTKVKSYRPSKPLAFVLEEQGDSVWAKPSEDPEKTLWPILLSAGEAGLTKRQGALAAFGSDEVKYVKRTERMFGKWVDQDLAVRRGRQPGPYHWVVTEVVSAVAGG